MICGYNLLSCTLHELLHWLFALAWCLVVLFLNWVIWRTTTYSILLPISGTNIFWYLGFWVSLSVVSHCIGDDVLPLPFWKVGM